MWLERYSHQIPESLPEVRSLRTRARYQSAARGEAVSITKAQKQLKKHLKQLEKTRDGLRELSTEIENVCAYAENAYEELERVIDTLSEIV